jgi:L-asparagine transporter-like permease
VITSISTLTLYLAYGIPIYLNWRNRRRGEPHAATPHTAPWNLGDWGPLVNAVAMAWIAVVTVIFSLPPNELVLWTMLGVAVGLAVAWRVVAHRRFRGPTPLDEGAVRRLARDPD